MKFFHFKGIAVENLQNKGCWTGGCMEELKISDELTREIFVGAFKERNLVPILGSGFTVGMPARGKNTVPDGRQLKQYMINQIIKKQAGINKNELEKETFSSIAELFEMDYANIKETGVSDYFYEHFTGVKIDKINQLRFLDEIDWQYIYTLNIDTGIENSNREKWEVFFPNRDFDERKSFGGKKKLYKIHGDANSFIKTLNYNEMILTESQYICSLDKNQKFHDMLSADCENKNILYLGCSLDDEIDIKYSVLSDQNRNFKEKETYRIYVTAEPMTLLKRAKLDSFYISHYIQLQSIDDYELFYEFLVQCFQKSLEEASSNIEHFVYQSPKKLSRDLEQNIKYLADIKKNTKELPYYYFECEMLNTLKFSNEKINVIIGRRFVGKTMLAYNILEHYQSYQRYFIMEQESIDGQAIQELMELKRSLIVFDSDSIDDRSFTEICNSFKADNRNLVCVFVNSYDDVLNLISYFGEDINKPIDHYLIGKMSKADIQKINYGLDKVGISWFDEEQNILDNTLRIANLYGQNMISDYLIVNNDELEIIIWILAQNKMYYEEICSLGLGKTYRKIVEKFSPFLQIEKCKRSEIRKHSTIKIVGNGKLGLLQILNNYAYPQDNEIGNVVAKQRHKNICDSIYHILYSFNKIDNEVVKKFIMFDTLNDIFSRKYSQKSIDFAVSKGEKGKNSYGAAGLIQAIYNDNHIQQLKAADPNYWLQRAKSVYIMYRHKHDISRLYQGIKWAIKAEQDSEIKVKQGVKQYYRTMSNAVIQIAIMYGRVAYLNAYKKVSDNNKAVEYYYKGLSDSNNSAAAKSLINNSKGTDDFNNLIQDIIANPNHIDQEWRNERDYLINVSIKGDIVYSS